MSDQPGVDAPKRSRTATRPESAERTERDAADTADSDDSRTTPAKKAPAPRAKKAAGTTAKKAPAPRAKKAAATSTTRTAGSPAKKAAAPVTKAAATETDRRDATREGGRDERPTSDTAAKTDTSTKPDTAVETDTSARTGTSTRTTADTDTAAVAATSTTTRPGPASDTDSGRSPLDTARAVFTARPRGPIRARRVHRIVRRIDPWSVLKLSLIFYFCVWIIGMIALVLLWGVAVSSGTIESVENALAEILAFEELRFNGDQLFQLIALGGLIGVFVATAVSAVLAVLFNLIAGLTGGIRTTVIEEETARRVVKNR
ncbi:MAG: DUF3566 domain-containing protein [Acidimicrobiales bacterium]